MKLLNLKFVESMDSRSVGPDKNDLRLDVDGKFPCGTRWFAFGTGVFPEHPGCVYIVPAMNVSLYQEVSPS